MANIIRGESSFQAEGQTYTLAFSHESLILLEEKLNCGILKIMKEMEEWSRDPMNIRLGTIRTMLWAGLQKHHRDLSLESVTDLISKLDGGIVTAVQLVGDGFQKAFSAPETKGTNPPQKDQNGTGTHSGSSTSAADTTQTPSGPLPRGSASFM